MRSLLDPKATPGVPKAVRQEAYYALKHFPWELHMREVAEELPDLFNNADGENNED